MFYISLAITALVLLASYVMKNKISKQVQLPPGPRGLPFFGVAFQLDPERSHLTLDKWAYEYGEMFTMKLFGEDFVVLNSYETIKECLDTKSKDFSGRPASLVAKVLLSERSAIFRPYSPKWLLMKKRMMQSIRAYSEVHAKLESISLDVIADVLATDIKQQSELGPVDFRQILLKVATSVMTSIIFGRKMEKDFISKALTYVTFTSHELGVSARGVCLDAMPSLRFTLLRSYHNKLTEMNNLIAKPVKKEILAIKENYISGEESCAAEDLLRNDKNGEDEMKPQLNAEEMFSACIDIFVGGISTTSLSLLSMIALLVNHPDIQRRMREELVSVVGSRKPRLADRYSMPYNEAVILEVLRLHTMGPLSVVHRTICDTSIKNYAIPAGTNVILNMWHYNHNAASWDEPYQFRPERFLDAEGQLLTPDHPTRRRHLPFGSGRRGCIGETLSRNRIFLIITSFLQRFEMLPEDGVHKRPEHDPRSYVGGLLIWPQDYKVKLKWFD